MAWPEKMKLGFKLRSNSQITNFHYISLPEVKKKKNNQKTPLTEAIGEIPHYV